MSGVILLLFQAVWWIGGIIYIANKGEELKLKKITQEAYDAEWFNNKFLFYVWLGGGVLFGFALLDWHFS